MATLPIKLPVGMVSIYGVVGSQYDLHSLNEVAFIKFGIVEDMYNQFGGVTVGQNVMFDLRESTPLFYDNKEYYLVQESKVGFTEDPPPP